MRTYPSHLPYGLEYVDRHTIRKTATLSRLENVKFLEILCNHLILHPDPEIVPVFDFKYIGPKYGSYEYSYDMRALMTLSPSEKRLVNRADSQYDRYGILPSQSDDEVIVKGWSEWLPLMQFIEKWMVLKRHRDIHDGNIMIDEEDNYLLVDLEGFIHSPLEDPVNSWITR
jgi:hypothetical protein